ncbi:hypothetical protein Tco_0093555 [Tanacetum coccineum]
MANLKFADTHNMVAFLSKPKESKNYQWGSTVACPSRWQEVIITEASVRSDLQLANEEDDVVHKELGDSLVRDATTTSSLEAKQDSGIGSTSGGGPRCQEAMGYTIAQTKFENVSKHSNDSLLARDEEITLVSVQDDVDKEMFDVDALNGEEVFVAGQNENVVEEVVDTAQDKGKGILIEPMKHMKKKDLIRLDEEVALKLQAKFDEEERLTREKAEKEQEVNIALIETWDDIQTKIDANHQLAKRLQAQEQEKLVFKRVNTFEDFRTELVKGKEKRARTELAQEITKKQKVEDDKETAEIKKLMEIIPDEEEIYMLVEKKYPLIPSTLTMMLEKKLMIDYESEMAYQLLKFIVKQLKK